MNRTMGVSPWISILQEAIPNFTTDFRCLTGHYMPEKGVVWTTKYRYKILHGAMRERIREIIRQTCQELGVHIEKGVLSTDHVHMFISVPPHIALSKAMMRIKGRSSYKIQREFPELHKRYWGRRFWARGYFSTTSGNVTDAVILQYLELHSKREPTDARR